MKDLKEQISSTQKQISLFCHRCIEEYNGIFTDYNIPQYEFLLVSGTQMPLKTTEGVLNYIQCNFLDFKHNENCWKFCST